MVCFATEIEILALHNRSLLIYTVSCYRYEHFDCSTDLSFLVSDTMYFKCRYMILEMYTVLSKPKSPCGIFIVWYECKSSNKSISNFNQLCNVEVDLRSFDFFGDFYFFSYKRHV